MSNEPSCAKPGCTFYNPETEGYCCRPCAAEHFDESDERSATPVDVSGIKLTYSDVAGRGKEIHAMIGQEFNCIEFRLRGDVPQPITWKPDKPIYICSEPWIQFTPKEWDSIVRAIFEELVSLWNERYGHTEGEK